MSPSLLTMVEAVLEQAARDDGHCFLTRAELHLRMRELIDTAISVGAGSERLVLRCHHISGQRVEDMPDDRVYLPQLEAAERKCTENIKRLLGRAPLAEKP